MTRYFLPFGLGFKKLDSSIVIVGTVVVGVEVRKRCTKDGLIRLGVGVVVEWVIAVSCSCELFVVAVRVMGICF